MNILFLQMELPPANFNGYLLWSIGILVGVVAFIFKLLNDNLSARLKEKDRTIELQSLEIKELHLKYDKLVLDISTKMLETKALTDNLIKLIGDDK